MFAWGIGGDEPKARFAIRFPRMAFEIAAHNPAQKNASMEISVFLIPERSFIFPSARKTHHAKTAVQIWHTENRMLELVQMERIRLLMNAQSKLGTRPHKATTLMVRIESRYSGKTMISAISDPRKLIPIAKSA